LLAVKASRLAALIDVPVNTLRMWDSGLRPVPRYLLGCAKVAATEHATKNAELLSLDQLARELGISPTMPVTSVSEVAIQSIRHSPWDGRFPIVSRCLFVTLVGAEVCRYCTRAGHLSIG